MGTLPICTFTYKNYKGEVEERHVTPHRLEFIAKPGFSYEPGWFLTGWDRDRNAERSFALVNIQTEENFILLERYHGL